MIGCTCLVSHLSSFSVLLGHKEIVKLLLDETTADDLDEPDADGMTALHWACYIGATEILQMLIAKGSRMESITSQRETALHIAAKRGHLSAVEALLDAGAHIDAMNGKGFTPLLLAAHVPYVDIAKRLIERGANYDLSMQKGSEDVESLKPPRKYSPYPAWYTPTDSSTWYTGRPSTSSSSSRGRPSTSTSSGRPSTRGKVTITRTTATVTAATRTSFTPTLPSAEAPTRNDRIDIDEETSKTTQDDTGSSRTAAAMTASSFWSDVLNSINLDRSSNHHHHNDNSNNNGITSHH